MSSHAPGPWARDCFRQIVDGNGQIVYVDNFTFGHRSTGETKANTKRIIACVNACEGFTTEELEGANLHSDSIGLLREILAEKRKCDELLAALEVLVEYAEAIASVIPAYGKSEKIVQARMAIGNVTE